MSSCCLPSATLYTGWCSGPLLLVTFTKGDTMLSSKMGVSRSVGLSRCKSAVPKVCRVNALPKARVSVASADKVR